MGLQFLEGVKELLVLFDFLKTYGVKKFCRSILRKAHGWCLFPESVQINGVGKKDLFFAGNAQKAQIFQQIRSGDDDFSGRIHGSAQQVATGRVRYSVLSQVAPMKVS